MDALADLIAHAESAEGAAAGFTRRHIVALKSIRADLALAATTERGIDAYRDLLLAPTPDEPLTAPKRVRARWAALRDLPNDAQLRADVLALAAELKRDDLLGKAWTIALNDYTGLMDLSTGAYQPIGSADDDADAVAARRAALDAALGIDIVGANRGPRAQTVLARADDLLRKLTGLLDIADYDGLAWSPETAQILRDDRAYVQKIRDDHRDALSGRRPPPNHRRR